MIPNGGDYGANGAVRGNDRYVKDPVLEMMEEMESMKKSQEMMEPNRSWWR